MLYDDPHGNHYGSFVDQGAGTIQADPQEVQRENEALQKVVTQTSKYACALVEETKTRGTTEISSSFSNHGLTTDTFCSHLVDIFALVSRNSTPAPSSTLPAHDARFLRYQTVLAKMSAHDQSSKAKHQQPNENTLSASEGWISGDDEVEETKSCKPVKSEGIGSILGGFADADSVMD